MFLWFVAIMALIKVGFEIGDAYGAFFGIAFGIVWVASAIAFIWLYDENPDAEYGEETAFALLGGLITLLILLFFRIKNRKQLMERKRYWAQLRM